MKRLIEMLTYKRPHESRSERNFIDAFLMPYAPTLIGEAAFTIEVLPAQGHSRTLFSCHIDTLHYDEGRQKVRYDPDEERLYKDDGDVLGADDGAGVWLLLEMIDNGVPGMYVFHRGEEQGGVGSRYLANHHGEWLRQFDRAVAFDRRGARSVITHQRGYRCCSEVFAQALADVLNADGVGAYAPDPTGVFTDTACYIGHIPECTNVSCGYRDEHTEDETLYWPTLRRLRDRCLVIQWDTLPVARSCT